MKLEKRLEHCLQPSRIGYCVVDVLAFLNEAPLDEVAMGFVYSLRPSCVRVVYDGTNLDYRIWRVTIYLDESDKTIVRIVQEVEVALPFGIPHGQALQHALEQRTLRQ